MVVDSKKNKQQVNKFVKCLIITFFEKMKLVHYCVLLLFTDLVINYVLEQVQIENGFL